MIRVAKFVPVPIVGGVGVSTLAYLRQMDHAAFAVDFFVQEALPAGIVREIEAAGGRVCVIPRHSRPLGYLRTTVRLLRAGRYDLVHAHFSTLSVFPLLAARLAGVPVRIAQSHTTSTFREPVRHLVKLLLRPLANAQATHFAACSESAGRWQFGAARVRAGDVCVLHTAIEIGRFAFDAAKRTRLRAELGFGERDLVVGLVGRLVTQKNPVRMVRLFAGLVAACPTARLLVIGDGPLEAAMRDMADRLGIAERVTFAGSKSDPAPYYNAMDVLAFPSLYEGLGRVLIEAQTNGLRGVASDAVPAEAKVSELVEFVPLAASDADWVAAFLRAVRAGRAMRDMVPEVAAAGYDIAREVSRNEDFYRHAVCRSGGENR